MGNLSAYDMSFITFVLFVTVVTILDIYFTKQRHTKEFEDMFNQGFIDSYVTIKKKLSNKKYVIETNDGYMFIAYSNIDCPVGSRCQAARHSKTNRIYII